MTNSILVIHPYKWHGIWVFDDTATGLKQEAFVSGMTDIFNEVAVKVGAKDKMTLFFSSQRFPNANYWFAHDREEYGGNWYNFTWAHLTPPTQKTGWLCPALFKYFATAPKNIYVQAIPRS